MTTLEQALAELAATKAKLATLQAEAQSKLSLKVGQSGTVCLNHGSRYPISLYRSQWEHVLPFIKSGAVERFIEANAHLLATKDAKSA